MGTRLPDLGLPPPPASQDTPEPHVPSRGTSPARLDSLDATKGRAWGGAALEGFSPGKAREMPPPGSPLEVSQVLRMEAHPTPRAGHLVSPESEFPLLKALWTTHS